MTTLSVGPHFRPYLKQYLSLFFVVYSRLAGPWCFWGLSGLHLPNLSMEHLGYRHVHYFVWLHAGSEDSDSGNGKHLPSPKNHFKVSLIVQKDDFLVLALWLGRLSIKLMSTIPLYDSLLLSLWLAYPHTSPVTECYKHMDPTSQVCEILSSLGMSNSIAFLA